MTFIFASLTLVLSLLLVVTWIRSKLAGSAIAMILLPLCICTLVVSLSGVSAMFTVSEERALIFQGVRYASGTFLAISLLHFVQYFTGFSNTIRKNRTVSVVVHAFATFVVVALLVDTVSLLSNFYFHHAFRVSVEYIFGSQQTFIYEGFGNLFRLHIALEMGLFLLSAFALWKKAIDSEGFYERQYIIVFVLMVVALVGEACMYKFRVPLDISLLLYLCVAIFLCWYPAIYVPNYLKSRMVNQAVDNETMGIVCFDIVGECIYANDVIYRLFPGAENIEQLSSHFLKWLECDSSEDFENCTLKKEDRRGGGASYYDVEKVTLSGKKKVALGHYFHVQDRTISVNRLERERYVTNHDSLTGLFKQAHFYTMAEKLIRENPDEEYYMVCSNIKDFKLINTLFGKNMGDQILVAMATALKNNVQPGAVFGRLSSDHFALLLPTYRFKEAEFKAEMEKIGGLIETENFRLQISLGVYKVTERKLPASIMCDRAFMALNTIKGDLGSTVAYYTRELMDAVLYEKRLIGEFDRALAQQDFQIYLQAQVNGDGKALGAEGLVRWIHPEWGVVPPGEFIPVFEKTGLIYKMDLYIWEAACKQLAKWKMEGIDKYISVNISPKDLYYVDIYKTFTGLIEKYELDVSKLHLELTESALMNEADKQIALLQRLRKYGFHVEIDDFGSGYSSLNLLKDIEVDILKLDMLFLQETDKEERSRQIMATIIELSSRLHMQVVCEGVEKESQYDYLKSIGCDFFQGYYFSKPIPVSEFEEKYCK